MRLAARRTLGAIREGLGAEAVRLPALVHLTDIAATRRPSHLDNLPRFLRRRMLRRAARSTCCGTSRARPPGTTGSRAAQFLGAPCGNITICRSHMGTHRGASLAHGHDDGNSNGSVVFKLQSIPRCTLTTPSTPLPHKPPEYKPYNYLSCSYLAQPWLRCSTPVMPASVETRWLRQTEGPSCRACTDTALVVSRCVYSPSQCTNGALV